MNKTTTTLAGFAVLATASMVPAAAQTFTASGPFTFGTSPLTVTSIAATFNPLSGPATDGFLSLTGGTSINGTSYTGTTLTFVSGTNTVSQNVTAFVFPASGGTDFIAGFAPASTFSSGFTFDLMNGTPAAVPEASTVVSFGALLALGGLLLLLRKSTVKNAA